MPPEKNIYILIGQKGSGKTLIGTIIQELYGITFVRVEDIARKVKKNREIEDESYLNEVFTEIESHLRNILKNRTDIVFESTGLTTHFDRMLKNLKQDFRVISIAVKADPELCLKRIKNRDQSIHINVSDNEAIYINSLVRKKNMECNFEINNDGGREEVVSALGNIFDRKE